jgi:iron complex transport system substrate-binding protein
MPRLFYATLAFAVCLCFYQAPPGESQTIKTPLDAAALKAELGKVDGVPSPSGGWPRTVTYQHEEYDFRKDAFTREERTFTLKSKPMRIIPHAMGVAEILWAICPRERIVAFNEFAADPEFSFIADEVKKTGPIFQSKETERVIGYRPDLVFTVFYSGADFKEKLKQADIPYFDLGYFGTMDSIKKQTLLIGKIIGEEGNAKKLVKIIDERVGDIKARLPKCDPPLRVLYYDEGGYVPGRSSNFNSICEMIQVINVGAEQGIKSWSQIDYETLLKWNPDIILVPQGSGIKEQLLANEILSHGRAIKEGKVYYIPGVYLSVDSQYMVLSANLLAGIVYEKAF